MKKECLKLLPLAIVAATLSACGSDSSSSGSSNSGNNDGDKKTANIGSGIHLKKGSEGVFVNSLIIGDYAECLYLDDNTVLTPASDTSSNPQDNIKNIYGHCVEAVNAGDSGYTVELAGHGASFAALDDKLAATGTSAVSATITSEEVDGSASNAQNLSANPNFSFDNTTYVGAVDPAASTAWHAFALTGSVPATAAAVDVTPGSYDAAFEPNVTFTPNMTGVTPATDCPAAPTGARITKLSTTYELDGQSFIACELSGDIMSDFTLNDEVVWTLVGRVVVGNGNVELNASNPTPASVSLTIDAGTVLMSANGSSLVITRGSEINAIGTAARPIVMAGDKTKTFGGTGEWGGLVLQGYAYHNKCGLSDTYCNRSGEGDTGSFAGYDNADSSGTLQYVIVTEAGAIVNGDGDELNGIGFMGVGYGTTVDYVQVHGNADDGVEFFGGAVDAKHLVLTANQDDNIDWDEGYVGNIQYALIVQTQNQAKTSNHAFELDTAGDANDSATQESNPTVANVTAIASLSKKDVGLED
ncbi:MAG: hypothetical protein K6L60_15780 [Oceanobacter sp.]